MRHGLRFEGVAVAGIGMVPVRHAERVPGRAHLARDAGLLALHDADMTLADVDEAFVGYIQPASMLGIKAMKELGLTGLPVTHVENASATGLVAFREAAWAVSSGRADVAMALCFDKFTDMTGTGGRGAGRDVIDAPILPASYFALWAQRRMHERGTTPEHVRDDRGEELELRRGLPDGAPTAGSRRHRRGGARVAHGRRAAHHDDVLPGRRRRRVRDPRPRGPRARAPARSPARAAARVGAAVGDVRARPHVRRAGRRPVDDDAGHVARVLRGGRARARGRERRVLPRRVRQRGARVLRAARVLRRGRGRPAGRRRGDRSRRAHPVQHRRRPDRPRSSRRPDRARHDPRMRSSSCAARPTVARSRTRVSRSPTSSAAAASAPSTCSASPTERTDPMATSEELRATRQGDPGPAVARDADRADGAVPRGPARTRLLRLRAADRVRHDLVASGPRRSATAR